MKLSTTQENLSKALNIVCRVAGSKTTLPILANIMLKTVKNRLQISATNLEVAITQFIGGKIDSNGSITVPARLMSDFVSSLPKDTINMELEKNKLHIKTKQYQSTINGIAADDFPSIPKLQNKNTIKIPISDLKKALQQVIFTASNDDSRPVLTGVYFSSQNGRLFITATDSYRLAEKQIIKIQENLSCIVPVSSLQHLLRILSEDIEENEVNISYDQAQILFTLQDIELVSRLIDGQYPDYQRLIPSKSDVNITLNREDFINITKVASLFAKESAGSITISVSEEDQEVSITSVASQVGENTSRAEAKIKGSGEVTLNSRYLLEALNAINDDKVTFRFSGKISPCVLTPADSKSSDYLHIIMPLKS